MYKTLVGMDKVEPIRNPEFDKVLLDNASCGYCASHQYELVVSWYLPVFQDLAARIASALKENGRDRLKEIRVATFQTRQDLHKRLLESRLADMGPKTPQTEEAFHKCMKRAAALAASMF